MRGQPAISRVYRLGARSEPHCPDAVFARVWRWCRELWVEQGTIAVRPDELPEEIREPLVAWANETYGYRRGKR